MLQDCNYPWVLALASLMRKSDIMGVVIFHYTCCNFEQTGAALCIIMFQMP